MPFVRRHRSPSPAVLVRSSSSSPKSSAAKLAENRSVGFMADPIASMSRELTNDEMWPLYDFEMHARTCSSCRNPVNVHRAQGELCSNGRSLARKATGLLYSRNNGADVFAFSDGSAIGRHSARTRVELPRNYPQTRSLLRAVERSQLYPNSVPILSFDRAYAVPPRPNVLPPSAWTGAYAATVEDEALLGRRASLRRSSTLHSASPTRHSRWMRRTPTDSDHEMPELTHSPSPSPSRYRQSRVLSPSSDFAVLPTAEPRIESLSKGLASLAVRSQREDLSGATLLATAEPKRTRRASFAAPSLAATPAGDFMTSVRMPPEKRASHGRASMLF